jgi:hypothetical protein
MSPLYFNNRDLDRLSKADVFGTLGVGSASSALEAGPAQYYQSVGAKSLCSCEVMSRLIATLFVTCVFCPVILMAWLAVGLHRLQQSDQATW